MFFLTGTDEHGEPVADAARAQGLEPKELADRNAERFKALMPQLNASNDFFIRTSDPEHMAKVQEVLQQVHDNGYTYKGLYEGWYCPRCADFKVENEILEGNLCPIHEIQLTRESEENWFFKLSEFQGALEELYRDRPDFVMPPRHFNEASAFISQGLQDVSLSRARLTGEFRSRGIRTTSSTCGSTRCSTTTRRSRTRARERTHRPVLAGDLPHHRKGHPQVPHRVLAGDADGGGPAVPEHVFVHGFLLGADGRKMSKSLGNVLDPFEVMDEYGTDALRFYLMRDVPFGSDGAVGIEGVRTRYDSELANEYGNLASRTLAMVQRYRNGVVPAVATIRRWTASCRGCPPRSRR